MDKAMRGPCRTRSSVEGAAGCAMARGLVSFRHLARCNPAGLDRMVPAPSPTRKYLLGRLSLLCALLAGLVVLVPPAAVSAVAASPHGVALIIGNADYEHRDVPDVTFAHRDADAFRRYVVDVLGYDAANVVDLRDATRRELFDALGTKSDARSLLWSYLDPDEGSDVVVFYSGHGVPGVNDKRGYLLPVDADPKAAEDDGYPIDLLYRNVGGLAEARSVRVWVYLDACFSGASHEGGLIRDASPVFVEAALPAGLGEKVMSLAAASGKQVASWDEGARHGLFTNHLLDALYGKGDADGDGRVTAREAKGYLDQHMTRAARRQHRRIQQASLVGAVEVVLASAGAGGAFPVRPGSGDTGAVSGAPVVDDAGETPAQADAEVKAPVPEQTPEEMEEALGLTREQKKPVQQGLLAAGLDVGVADGLFGPRTRAELRAYQKKKGYPETGRLSGEQAEALMALGKEWQAERGEVGPTEGEVFRDCDGTWCPEMVVVPAGSFMMGSPSGEKGRDADEGPVHGVRISEPFAVGVYEVTFEEWEACRRGGGCSHDPDDKGWGRGRRPVINVSWQDAQAYVRWLSRVTGKAYRLLSESEWEYVARAGTTGPFHFGSTITTEQANYGFNRGRTAPVGSFPANAFGLHDVHGNVMERVEDCWHASYRGAPGDGSAWTRGGNCDARVLRGGSWYYGPQYLRSANRYELTAANRFSFAGFRAARTLD